MNKLTRIIIITLSLAYVGVVVSAFTSDRLRYFADERAGERDYVASINLIDKAIALDPMNADLYFRKYEIISDLLKVMREKGDSPSVILSEADLSADSSDVALAKSEVLAKEEGRDEESKSSSLSPLASSLVNSQFTIHDLRKLRRHLVKHCIELRPFWPKYHFVYGLLLSKISDKPNYMLKNSILAELKKAADLKPYSKMYQKIYQKRLNLYK